MEPVILHIETSTNVCSVALSEGKNCLFSKSNDEGMNHAALLSVFIDEALQVLKKSSKTLNAVAVSAGPGSYTGLRIGVSTAKGMCYGLDIPLIALDTLEILAVPAIQLAEKEEDALFCPMIDARRMEVYDIIYQHDRTVYRGVEADIISSDSFVDTLNLHKMYFFGNGAEKCKPVLTHPNACFLDNLVPLATNMIDLALQHYQEKKFVDTAYFEPFYLKEFQTTTPRKNVL